MVIAILIKPQSLFVHRDGSMPLSSINNEVFSSSVASATAGHDQGGIHT